MRRLFALAMILSVTGCATSSDIDEDEDFTDDAQAIVNGSIDNVHFAVGELILPGGGRCSGTAIGLRWVLTAAHCVSGVSPGQITFNRYGSFVYGPVQVFPYSVDQVHVHPSYVSGVFDHDVALVRLTADVNTTPIPLTYAAPSVTNAVTVVGFGLTASGATYDGVRRSAANAVDVLYTNVFDYYGSSGSEGNICQGDSGGATLRVVNGVEAVLGVNVASSTTCGSAGRSSRSDVHAGWVVQRTGTALATVGWRNPNLNVDVNGDGYVSPIDSLLIINYLNAGNPSQLPAQRVTGSSFYDTNGDGYVSPIDSLLVINYLNSH
ncbi:MAG: trypsin-like serine protease [Polyangiaceae bacterium]